MPIYNQSQLQSDVNARIKGKVGILVDTQSTLNQAVREVLTDMDLLTTRRRVALTPNLFQGIFEYAAPTDLKGYGIITVQNQKWTVTPNWELVPYEQFLRRQDRNTLAVSDYDFIRKVFMNSVIDDTKVTVSNLDSLTSGGGTWGGFGDAENVEAGTDNFVEGNASVKFDIDAAGGTTAGIVNSTLDSTDQTAFFQGDGNCTAWAYITSTTNLTNFIFRIGSDSTNYYSKTVTAQSDGTDFVDGWNLLNFDLSTFDTTGTPVITATTYSAIYFTKTAGKISEVGYRFDDIVLRRGEINNLYYYSSYGWQTSAGVYIADSTTASDFVNAGPEEYQLILAKASELAADEVDEDKVSAKQASKYEKLKKAYEAGHPSESQIMISTTADFVTLGGVSRNPGQGGPRINNRLN